jgi:hypothetical protein
MVATASEAPFARIVPGETETVERAGSTGAEAGSPSSNPTRTVWSAAFLCTERGTDVPEAS